MMFWFKKKKIVLDCFTTDSFAYEHAKIAPSTQYYPDWWKKLPFKYKGNEGMDSNTMRHCKGFTNLYKNSLTIPSWGGIFLELSNDIQHKAGFNTNYELDHFKREDLIVQHSVNQFAGFVNTDKYAHFKIHVPWFIQCKSEVGFFMSDCLWNRQNLTDYSVLPGIIDFKYQNAVNINVMLEFRKNERTVKFIPGDPLCQLTPLTEDNVILKHHLITSNELLRVSPNFRLNGLRESATSYIDNKKFLQKKEEREKDSKPKCPFGFGK